MMAMDSIMARSDGGLGRVSSKGKKGGGGLLKNQLELVKRKDCDRYTIAKIPENLSFEKGFYMFIRACQLLAQKNEGISVVGLAGPSGAGKTVFCDKVLNFMPGIVSISMDNYNDASRLVDGNFDDPALTDYDTLLQNILDLKDGKPVKIPVYDFKCSCRTGYRDVDVPSSRIVIIEGIHALNEQLRPLLDLCVSVTGGVHFDLVKRVLRDIGRCGQEPAEIIAQISETDVQVHIAGLSALVTQKETSVLALCFFKNHDITFCSFSIVNDYSILITLPGPVLFKSPL